MTRRPWTLWIVLGLSALVPAITGQNCVPRPSPTYTSVFIELANYTDFEVEPRLFIDPVPGLMNESDLIRDENWVFVDPPLQPGELATYEFLCEDVGTMASDYAEMFISDTEYIPSDNGPWLVEGYDFECGDTIRFSFIDDGTVFFTRVEVNGEFLTD